MDERDHSDVTEKDKSEKNDKDKDDAGFLLQVQELVRAGRDYWSENFQAAEDDLRFLDGEQWPDGVMKQREADGRPCLTNNVLPTFVDTVLGDQRQNKPQIKINPVSLQLDAPKMKNTAGTKDYSLAETMTAIVKNIEYMCDAESAYDFAFQAGVESGIGFLRVRNDYLSDDSFDQDIIVENLLNQFNVIIDPNAKLFCRQDMNWAFIGDTMDKISFERKYSGKRSEAPQDGTDMGSWFGDKTVGVGEFYERKKRRRKIALLSDGQVVEADKIQGQELQLQEQGLRVIREREVDMHEVYWYKVTYYDILEGPTKIPTSYIPIVPVFGKMRAIKGKIKYRSIIRNSKDAQRMLNYWDSAATESVALAPKAPFIASGEQIEGYEDDWENANTKNLSVLKYNQTATVNGAPQRAQGAQVPAAEITLAMNANEKIKGTMGIFDASIGNESNETSGKAIIARQRQGDRGSFAYIDNLSKSIRQVGKILIEMIPQIYDSTRVMRLKFHDETEDFVKINQMITGDDGQPVLIHDLNAVKYDVVVTTGPSYATQRMEAAESMIAFAQAVPNAAALMGDLIAQVMDWPNAEAITKRLRKALPPNMLSQEEQARIQEETPETPPTPEQQLAEKDFEVKQQELAVRQAEAESDATKAQSQVRIAELKLQEMQIKLREANINLSEQVQDLVAQSLAEFVQSTRGAA